MYSLLLALIYVAFISLGLPDSLLGSAWPTMQPALGVPLSYAGIISMIIAGGTVISSLLSDKITKKLGAGLVTAGSVLLTALAMLGFSLSNSFLLLCVLAVPYGLGAGSVDAALNNFVALHYSSRHMSWLHCFWGVGAAVSPYIMGYFISGSGGWQGGYQSIGFIQVGLTAILFLSLPLWKKAVPQQEFTEEERRPKPLREVIKIPGVVWILLAFFGYCGMETTTGLWASSFLVIHKGIDGETAARFASLFYIGITVGRFLCGFIADRVGDKNMVRLGLGFILSGIVLVALPVGIPEFALGGLIVIGLGCAPVYPSIIHATPVNFGRENSQALVGVQMASAYMGSTFMPPLFGLIAEHASIVFYPFYLLLFAGLMAVMTELVNRLMKARKAQA